MTPFIRFQPRFLSDLVGLHYHLSPMVDKRSVPDYCKLSLFRY